MACEDAARSSRGVPSGTTPLARRFTGEIRAQFRHCDPADGRPVEIPVDQFLDVGEAEVRPFAADLDQQFLDTGMVPLVRSAGAPGRANLGQQIINHIAHLLIFGDRVSRLQVMPGFMLARRTRCHGSLACALAMR